MAHERYHDLVRQDLAASFDQAVDLVSAHLTDRQNPNIKACLEPSLWKRHQLRTIIGVELCRRHWLTQTHRPSYHSHNITVL